MSQSIPLYSRYHTYLAYALVDDDDAPLVAPFRWRLWRIHQSTLVYAARAVGGKSHRKTILMHRYLLGIHEARWPLVDHINRNGLDNQRANLRTVTHAENMQNRQSHRGSTSAYRGVYWDARTRRWIAVVRHGRKKIFEKFYMDELEAAAAARQARLALLTHAVD